MIPALARPLVLLSAWIMWTFTVSPGAAFRYEGEADIGLGWTTKTLYANTTLDPKVPRYASSPDAWVDTVWTVCTTNGAATNLRVRAVNVQGQPGPWSNAAAVVPKGTYARDTTLYGFRENLWLVSLGGATVNATFSAPMDTLQRPLVVWTLDMEQSQNAAAHCNACKDSIGRGYYWQRGIKQTCW